MGIINLLVTIFDTIGEWFYYAYKGILAFYYKQAALWPLRQHIKLIYALIIAFVVVVAIIVILLSIIRKIKKRKVKFYIDNVVNSTQKLKYGEALNFPIVEKEGKEFIGWYTDKKLFKQYKSDKLEKRKNLKLYAKYKVIGEDRIFTALEKEAATVRMQAEMVAFSDDIAKLYDDIRYEMLGYERATPFKGIGVTRKQIVAEMFEKNGVINLYLALDPEFMKEKGYSVSCFTEPEFAVVPCKKIIKNQDDYLEAINLIKEAMILNNFVKCEHRVLSRSQSDEKIRKNGFAFFVKNEVIATSAADYYKFLRGMVLCYSLAPGNQFSKDLDNKMILKIFKKGEQIFLYLALDAEKEGLEFVGYDKNFFDTPCKYEIKDADGLVKANQLIDKLMCKFGMEKRPEEAELFMDEEIKESCGFGYRIRH